MSHVPQLQLEGRSGCLLQLVLEPHHPVVHKYAKDEAYNPRLVLQAQKQRDFQFPQAQRFAAPRVLETHFEADEALHWFKMDYQYGLKYSDYLEQRTVAEVDQLCLQFADYFAHFRQAYPAVEVSREVIEKKLASVQEALTANALVNEGLLRKTLSYLAEQVPEAPLEQGPCHGDFTLSNMIFQSSGTVYLVDFLDSFLESPLIDLVKLRQDTRYHWSLMIEGDLPRYRRNKIVQVLHYLDCSLEELLTTLPHWQAWYQYLQVFNLLRILPYLHDSSEVKFVETHINELLP